MSTKCIFGFVSITLSYVSACMDTFIVSLWTCRYLVGLCHLTFVYLAINWMILPFIFIFVNSTVANRLYATQFSFGIHKLVLLNYFPTLFGLFPLVWMFLCRYTPSIPHRQFFGDLQRDRCLETNHIYFSEHGYMSHCSNFLDLDRLSSSGNSCEEEQFER